MRPRLYNIAHSSRFSQMGHRGESGRMMSRTCCERCFFSEETTKNPALKLFLVGRTRGSPLTLRRGVLSFVKIEVSQY